MNDWFVYILRCGDDSLYTGITNNLVKRLKAHRDGKGAKYTRGRLPLTLEVFHTLESKSEALKLEYKIKQMKKDKKIHYLRSLINELIVYKPRSIGPSTTNNNPNYILGVDVANGVDSTCVTTYRVSDGKIIEVIKKDDKNSNR